MFFLQYRGNLTLKLNEQLQRPSPVLITFTTLKIKTCLPSLRSNFDCNLKSHVVYEIKFSECSSTYVWQMCRHLTTWASKERCGQSKAFEWRSIDKSNGVERLLTLEALHKSKRKPQLNTRDEYRSRELTLKN